MTMNDNWENHVMEAFKDWWKDYSSQLDADVRDNAEVEDVAEAAFFAGLDVGLSRDR